MALFETINSKPYTTRVECVVHAPWLPVQGTYGCIGSRFKVVKGLLQWKNEQFVLRLILSFGGLGRALEGLRV